VNRREVPCESACKILQKEAAKEVREPCGKSARSCEKRGEKLIARVAELVQVARDLVLWYDHGIIMIAVKQVYKLNY
jgi:hypothetical protein